MVPWRSEASERVSEAVRDPTDPTERETEEDSKQVNGAGLPRQFVASTAARNPISRCYVLSLSVETFQVVSESVFSNFLADWSTSDARRVTPQV